MSKSINLTATEVAYISNVTGQLTSSEFETPSGHVAHCGNFKIVEQMASNGVESAISGFAKLQTMSSRERSESGIYYKLQQKKEWTIATEQLLGIAPNKAVTVTYTTTITKDTISRQRAFRYNSSIYGEAVKTAKVDYCNETITITRTISEKI